MYLCRVEQEALSLEMFYPGFGTHLVLKSDVVSPVVI
jgi:hypothetical protein